MPPIYHITHIRNLPSIIEYDGLLCDADAGDIREAGIAHEHIKERRARRQVSTGPDGTLADYVPFYFSPRSPMLYVNHMGQVPNNPDGQVPILHLVSSTETVARAGLAFVFTNGHADMAYTDFYDDLDSLVEVDWSIMGARYWSNSDEDRWKRQAEFLVHKFFPWANIELIGVIDEGKKQEVELLIRESPYTPTVVVKRRWYY